MSRIHEAKVHTQKTEESVCLNTEISGKKDYQNELIPNAAAWSTWTTSSSTAIQSCQLTALSQAGFLNSYFKPRYGFLYLEL